MEHNTLREIVSEFKTNYKLENANEVRQYSDRYIGSRLQNISLLFIKQRTDKRKLWNTPVIYQEIPCLQLKQVPLAECCGYVSSCTIAKSVLNIPKIAEGNNFNLLIQGVYSIEFPKETGRKFIESSADRYANFLDLGLRTNEIHFWIQNDHLYISDPNIEKVKLSACFTEDIPDELMYSCFEKPCCPVNPLDLPFRCPKYLYDDVLKELERQFAPTINIPNTHTSGISK